MSDEINPKKDIEQNPIGKEVRVEVSMPEKFDIKMVEASTLGDYELWVFIASLVCNFLVGFVVATISNADDNTRGLYIGVDIMLGVFFITSVIMVIVKRKKMSFETKTIKLGMQHSGE